MPLHLAAPSALPESAADAAALTLALAMQLHQACHDAVVMARLWQQHARRGAPGAQRVLLWKEAAPVSWALHAGAPARLMACTWLDLARQGPWLLELPHGVRGTLDNSWLAPLGRFGAQRAGAAPGRYLLLAPAQDVLAPPGVTVVRSSTHGAWLTLQCDSEASADANAEDDPATALPADLRDAPAGLALARLAALQLRPHSPAARHTPLALVERIAQRGHWPGLADERFFTELARLVAHEGTAALAPPVRDQLARIGIRAGQPFVPDEALRQLLAMAALQALQGHASLAGSDPFAAAAGPPAPEMAPRWQRAFVPAASGLEG